MAEVVPPADGTCLTWGCGRFAGVDSRGKRHGSRGYCYACYHKLRDSGDLVPFQRPPKPPCTVCGETPQHAHGLCVRHYYQWKRRKDGEQRRAYERERSRRRRKAARMNQRVIPPPANEHCAWVRNKIAERGLTEQTWEKAWVIWTASGAEKLVERDMKQSRMQKTYASVIQTSPSMTRRSASFTAVRTC